MSNQTQLTSRWGAEICYLVLLVQLPLHIVLLRLYFKIVGQPGDVGSNYLAFWIMVILPATILLSLASGFFYRRWVGRSAERRRVFFVGFCLVDIALLMLSFPVYASMFQG